MLTVNESNLKMSRLIRSHHSDSLLQPIQTLSLARKFSSVINFRCRLEVFFFFFCSTQLKVRVSATYARTGLEASGRPVRKGTKIRRLRVSTAGPRWEQWYHFPGGSQDSQQHFLWSNISRSFLTSALKLNCSNSDCSDLEEKKNPNFEIGFFWMEFHVDRPVKLEDDNPYFCVVTTT